MRKNKKDIIAEFDAAILAEEMAVPIYTSHILTTLERSGLPKDQVKKINQGMKVLARESLRHIGILKSAKKFLKERE